MSTRWSPSTASTRLRQLGVTAPGATIALAGGVLAAGSLGLADLLGWTLSRPDVSIDGPLVRAAYFLIFLVGGPGHIVALGLLVAGMAVPSRILGLLPRSLAWTGLAIALLAELTTVVLVWPGLGVMLPVARVSALAAGGGCPVAAAAGRPSVSATAVRAGSDSAGPSHAAANRRNLGVQSITTVGGLDADFRCVAKQGHSGGDRRPR